MKMLTLNWTDRARDVAALIGEHCCESHRGAMRDWNDSEDESSFTIVLYGNDGYAKREDSDPVIHARTKAYVHNLYAGLANLLPEGAVEFGTDESGSTWVILANFPRHDDHDDFHDEDADDDQLLASWNNVVWKQWESQLAATQDGEQG